MNTTEALAQRMRADAGEVASALRSASARAALVARWERACERVAAGALAEGRRGEIPVAAHSDTVGFVKVRTHTALIGAMMRACEAGGVGDARAAGVRRKILDASAHWWAAADTAVTQNTETQAFLRRLAVVKRQIERMDDGAGRGWWTVRGEGVEQASTLDSAAWRALEEAPQWLGARILGREPGRATRAQWPEWAREEIEDARGRRRGPPLRTQAVRAVLERWPWSAVAPPLAIVGALALEGETLEGEAEWGAACEMEEEWTRWAGWTGTARRVRARAAQVQEAVERGIERIARAKTQHCWCAGAPALESARALWARDATLREPRHGPVRLEAQEKQRTMVWRAAYTDVIRVLAGLDGDCTAYEVEREMRDNEALLIPTTCRVPDEVIVSGKARATDVAGQARRGEALAAIAQAMCA